MRQFSVGRIKSNRGRQTGRLVLVLQHAQLEELKTRIVAPLLELAESAPVAKLAPQLTFDGRAYRVSFHKMATVDARDLEFVGRLDCHDLLMRAADLIFAGV